MSDERFLYEQSMKRMLPDLEQVRKEILGKGLKKKSSTRWLVPVAACACACALLFTAFPESVEAVKMFFQRNFDVASYMRVPAEKRTEIGDVQAVIQAPAPVTDSKILLGAELPDWELISEDRKQNDFPAFDQSAFAWLKDAKAKVREVMYDGNRIIVTGQIKTAHPEAFYRDYMPIPEAKQWISMVGATLKLDSDAEGVQLAGGSGLQLDPAAYTEGEQGVLNANMEYIRQADVPFYVEFELANAPEGFKISDGITRVEVSMDINDGSVDQQGDVGKIAQLRFDTIFDATKGNTSNRTLDVQQQQTLDGKAIITLGSSNEKEHFYSNMEASLDGMELLVDQVESSQTGMRVRILEKLPPSWTEEMKQGYYYGYSAKYGGLKFKLLLDGTEQEILRPSGGSVGDNASEWNLEIPILPSELAGIQSIQLVPIIEYMTAFNGEPVPMGEKKAFTPSQDGSWEDTTEYTQLDKFALTIQG